MDDWISREAVLPILAGLARTQMEYNESYDKLMQIPSVNRWIPCSERLPEENRYVLALAKRAHKSRVILSALINGTWKIGVNDCSDGFDVVGVITHWMPMPEPPEKE